MYVLFLDFCGAAHLQITNITFYTINLQMMMKQQDEGLEMLGQSADRLSKISMGIHEELGHQNK